LTSDGHWLLQPLYDSIDTQYASEWTVTKDNKKSLFTRKGFLLPFRFEQVWNMNDDYFNITQNGKWGVYRKSKDSVVVPCVYEDMDYCYGCELKGDYCFAEKNAKWGIVDFKNNVLLPFEYDHEHMNMTSGDIVYCLSKNGQQLAINLKTKQIDTCNCNSDNDDNSTVLAHGFIRIKKNDKYGLLNPEGKLVLDCAYDYIRYDADTSGLYLPDPYVQISRNNLWGVADTTGKILLSPKYHSVLSFLKIGFFVCETGTQDNNYKEVLTNKSGRQVLSDSYDEITLKYCDSLATPYLLLKKNHLYGIYNPENKTLVSPQFDDIEEYKFDVAYPHAIVIKKENREGVLDIASGKIIMPMLYHSIENNHLPDGLMIVYDDEKYGLYDYHKKQLMVPLKYTYIGVTENHRLFKISKGTSYGLMDFEGKVLIPEKYFEIHSLDTSLYALTSEDSTYRQTYNFYNGSTHQTYGAPFDTVQAVYSDTLAVVTDKGKFKLWNPLNGKIITGDYAKDGFPDNIDYFFYGKAVFFKNGKAGLMDEAGNILIQPAYSGMTNFYHGYALVLKSEKKNERDNGVATGDSAQIVQHAVSNISQNTHYGIVDSTGKLIIPVVYDYDEQRAVDIYFMDSCFLLIKNTNDYNQLIGLADRNGKEIIPPVYDDITPQINDTYYMVQKNKKFGILDKSGNIVLPVIFDNIALNEVPLYDTKYNFSFPLLAEKDGIWQYYKRNGTTLPIKIKSNIPFDNSVSGY
ncbi:MAG TPA: WG repeat-containing protein, partial [Arachidicoccus sp.]